MERSIDDLPWLLPGEPFPAAASALDDPNGLLAIGADLSPDTLLRAYRGGIFPWFSDDQPILWWSPDPRMVLLPEKLHCSRSLRKRLRNTAFEFSIDQAFPRVMSACAAPRDELGGSWITDEMHQAYCRLQQQGHAHSIEVWLDQALVGGLYGVSMGGVFFGESMFSRVSDASKAALTFLCLLADPLGIRLIDCQVSSDHLHSLGAREMPRARFLELLKQAASDEGSALAAHAPAPLAQYLQDYRLERNALIR